MCSCVINFLGPLLLQCMRARMLSWSIRTSLNVGFLGRMNTLRYYKYQTKRDLPWTRICSNGGYSFGDLLDDHAVRTDFLPFGDLPDGSCKKTNSGPATVLVTGNN